MWSVAQWCPNLYDPMGCSLPGSSVHEISQAGILEWVAMPSSKDLPDPGIKPASLLSPALAGGFFTTSTTWGVHEISKLCFSAVLISEHIRVRLLQAIKRENNNQQAASHELRHSPSICRCCTIYAGYKVGVGDIFCGRFEIRAPNFPAKSLSAFRSD